jgi:hypothetical protein
MPAPGGTGSAHAREGSPAHGFGRIVWPRGRVNRSIADRCFRLFPFPLWAKDQGWCLLLDCLIIGDWQGAGIGSRQSAALHQRSTRAARDRAFSPWGKNAGIPGPPMHSLCRSGVFPCSQARQGEEKSAITSNCHTVWKIFGISKVHQPANPISIAALPEVHAPWRLALSKSLHMGMVSLTPIAGAISCLNHAWVPPATDDPKPADAASPDPSGPGGLATPNWDTRRRRDFRRLPVTDSGFNRNSWNNQRNATARQQCRGARLRPRVGTGTARA